MSLQKPSIDGNSSRMRGMNSFATWLTGALLFTLIIACAPVGPDYLPPQPELPTHWQQNLPSPVSSVNREILEHWWTEFNDPKLESLINRATLANHDLQIAASRIIQTRSQYRFATGTLTPQVDGSSSATNSGRSKNIKNSSGNTQNLFQAGFDANWEIDIFGGTRRTVEAAQARLDAAVESRNDVLISLQAEVARNYMELRGSQQRLKTAKNNLDTQQQTVELARERRVLGFGTGFDVAQAETLLALTKAQLPVLRNSISQSGYRLDLLLGLPPGLLTDELSENLNLSVSTPQIPALLPSDLLLRRPDLRRAERQLAAATAEVGVAVAGLYPKFSLNGLIGLQSTHLGDLLTGSSRYWTVGPSIDWALFDGGRIRADIDLNRAQREEAQLNYEKTILVALSEVENALLNLTHETEVREALITATVAAQTALDLAAGKYQAGMSGMLDVLLSQRALYQAQDQLILSRQHLNLNLVALFKALGGGWQGNGNVTNSTT